MLYVPTPHFDFSLPLVILYLSNIQVLKGQLLLNTYINECV